METTIKSLKKDNSFSFHLLYDSSEIELQGVRPVDKDRYYFDFNINFRDSDTLTGRRVQRSGLMISNFKAHEIQKDVLHLYTGEIHYGAYEPVKFVVANDLTALNGPMPSVYRALTLSLSYESIKKECIEELKKTCGKNGVIESTVNYLDGSWTFHNKYLPYFGMEFICTGQCNNK